MHPSDAEFKLHLLSTLKSITASLRNLRFQSSVRNYSHAALVSHATYCPWLDDANFQQTFEEVSQFSLVDVYRLYQLWDLVGQVCQSKELRGDILEVGSWRGGSGCLIARRCRDENCSASVFLADTFKGVVKAGPRDPLYKGGEHSDTSLATVLGLRDKLSLPNIQVLEGQFPEETACSLTDRRFRFCHIDVDSYQSGKDVFDWVWPRLERTGIVVFDDYGFWGCEGITQFVQEIRGQTGCTFLYNLSGQAVLIKTG